MTETKTIEQHAHDLRNFAELTAKHSNNWDNFEQIALKMLEATFEAGKSSANGS
jgi:hypothetical protein